MRINLTDNNIGCKEEGAFRREDVTALFPIASKTISQLCAENDKLLIFPYNIDTVEDGIGESSVLTIENTEDSESVKLVTGNVVGFIGIGNLKVKIQSRFDKGRDDYFLHYMLQKVLSFNLFDLKHNNEQDDVFDFIMFMFPYLLKSAMRQGVYREYQRQEFDDAKVKGVIAVNRFIRQDVPFRGKVAYSVRNYCYDNAMTQLIRHTIEYMKTKKYGQNILSLDRETIDNVNSIIENTPSYNRQERNRIIQQNLRPKIHPYYTEYKALQSLCIQILRMEEVKYGEDDNEVCGILFDVAWLWEEYVNTLLEPYGFEHPQNKKGTGGIRLFDYVDRFGVTHNCGVRYPDFYKDDFVLDAKYKRLGDYEKVSKVDRNDIHQLVTYVTRLEATKGGFIAPLGKRQEFVPYGHLKNSSATLAIYGIQISKDSTSYKDFSLKMAQYENRFIQSLKL